MTIDCVYRVSEHYGSYGSQHSYLERVGYRPFYQNGVAIIVYDAQPLDSGGYLLQFEVMTQHDEVVAIRSWTTKHESEYNARIDAIEAAMQAARAYDSRVTCLIDGKLADDVIEELEKKEKARLKELQEQMEAVEIG